MPPRHSPLKQGTVSGIGKPSQPQPPTSPERFRAGRAPRPNDVFIAVMGVTGSGMSSFISRCSGESAPIGHTLEACTTAVTTYAYDMSPERTVYLIDTPGFDGTNKNDTEVLSEVATWLADSYQSKIRLHGIIFLHRITDNRLQGSAKRTLAILRKLCGPDALKRVVLVTTMSNKAAEEEAVVARGKLLTNTDDLWGGMLSQGSSCYRHDNTASTAKAIVNLLASHDEPVATDLQRQLVDEHQPLDETGAGRVLDAEMAREKDAWKQERLQMQQDTERAIKERDQIEDQTRRDERDKYTARIELMVENNNRLHSTMERLLADREQRVGRLETELREQRAAHMAEIKRLKSDAQRREEQAVLLATTDRERQGQREEIDELRRQVEQLTTAAGSGTREETEDVNGQDSFCFALNGNLAVCLNLGGIHGAWMSEKAKRTGSGRLQAVSFGVASGGGIVWIGKYSDGTWHRGTGLGIQYPDLDKKLKAHGLDNLEYCVLGPDSCYYARWKNGRTCWEAPAALSKFLTAMATWPSPGRIRAVAFGHGGAFVAAYYVTEHPQLVYHYQYLRGDYRDLDTFLSKERTKAIYLDAIALDPSNTTDFIVSYRIEDEDELQFNSSCSDETIKLGIESWVAASRKGRGTCLVPSPGT